MVLDEFEMFFARELDTLKKEISAYSSDEAIWTVPTGISNSTGTLALHLVGNLNHFVGALLGDTGFVRQRDKEFTDRDVPRATIIAMIDDTAAVVKKTIQNLKEADIHKPIPFEVMNRRLTYNGLLVQLIWHLGYHNGQINYHRRLTDI